MIFLKISRISFLSAIFVSLMAITANAKAVKDTPVPADHQCNFVNFHHNEAKNTKGAGKCETDCDCDGMRSCIEGSCSGKARPEKMNAASCNSKDFHYQEAWTPAGAGKCSGDCECDGTRTCVSGTCMPGHAKFFAEKFRRFSIIDFPGADRSSSLRHDGEKFQNRIVDIRQSDENR